jgi:hypothetical protein
MANEHDKFVQNMLKSATEKKEAKPQTRYEGTNKEEIEQMAKNIIEQGAKSKLRSK